jgi:hypothetical protein
LTIILNHVLCYQIASHQLNPCRRALNNSSKFSPKSSSFTRIRNIDFIYLKWHLWFPDQLLTSKSMLKYLALQSTRNDATRWHDSRKQITRPNFSAGTSFVRWKDHRRRILQNMFLSFGLRNQFTRHGKIQHNIHLFY